MDRTSAIFERATADLKERLGVGLSDLTAEETVALVKACMKVADPYSEVNADAAGFPVRVCEGVWFNPLTIGSVVWLEETADRWWEDDLVKYRNALVYASVHARDRDAFVETERSTCERIIRTTLRRVTATSAEIDAALCRILSVDTNRRNNEKDLVESTATSWAELVAKTEAGTGIPREHWLWGVGYRETLRAYHEMRGLALSRGGEKAARMLDELDEAVNRLQRVKVNIMKRVKNG